MEVEGSNIEILKKFKEQGIQVDIINDSDAKQERHKLTICANDTIQGSQILQALHNPENCIVHSLTQNEPNLEEIFLAATKRSWEETIEVPKSKESINMAGNENSISIKT